MRKARRGTKAQIDQLSQALLLNGEAIKSDRPKSLTHHDLRTIRPMTDNQALAFDAFEDYDHVVLNGSPGSGKAQPLRSKILTPTGWTTMGKINVGDEVLTPKMGVAKVVGVFPQGTKDIYTVTFSDGSKAESCLEHLWECYMPSDIHRSKPVVKRVVSTQEIIETLKLKELHPKSGLTVAIDMVDPIKHSPANLSIPPYTLGVILGDGSITTSTVVISCPDQFVQDRIHSEILDGSKVSVRPQASRCLNYSLINKIREVHEGKVTLSQYAQKLTCMGLMGTKSYSKFIPDEYITSSVEQRMDLINGLFDTDGTVGKQNKEVSYTTTSEIMAKQVQDIIWSLGGKCSLRSRITFYTMPDGTKKAGRRSYTLRVSYVRPSDLFSLPRKKSLCRDNYDMDQYKRWVSSVELTSHEEAQCIMIDDPSHLYVTDDYIITHNTFLSSYHALKSLLVTKEQTHIKIIRSAVECRSQGFLPGDLAEKSAPYENPYHGIFHELLGRATAYDHLKKSGQLSFETTGFLRGLTFINTFIIVDEAANLTLHEIDTIMTRIGDNSRIVFCGDIKQSDLKKNESGYLKALRIWDAMDEFSTVTFSHDDIVRSGVVKSWIIASENIS